MVAITLVYKISNFPLRMLIFMQNCHSFWKPQLKTQQPNKPYCRSMISAQTEIADAARRMVFHVVVAAAPAAAVQPHGHVLWELSRAKHLTFSLSC